MPIARIRASTPANARSLSGSSPSPAPSVTAYDPTQDQERVRGQLALWLVGLMAAIALLSLLFVMVASDKDKGDAVKAVLQVVFSPIIGLVGTVTGFYYGQKSKSG